MNYRKRKVAKLASFDYVWGADGRESWRRERDEMTKTLVIIGLLTIAPFAVGCSDNGGTGGTAGGGGSAGTGGAGGDGGSAGTGGQGGSGGTTVLPDGGVCSGTNTPCEIGCEGTNCSQQCDGDLNTGGTIEVVCSATCDGGGCTQECEDGATCTFTCDGGGCSQSCDAESTCNFTCTGGDCT